MTEEEIKNKKNCVLIDKTKFKGKDHAEEIYNYLKCIEPSYRVGRKIYWKCVCLNCGSITYCRIDQLQNNEILSCGCHKESKKVHIGDIFGRLTVIDFAEDNSCGQKCFKCRCSCGNTVIVAGNKLRTGHTKSCGCLNKEITKKLSTTHGFSKTRLYRIWRSMLSRCTNINNSQYKNYGDRGIMVCDRWKKFENFKEDMYDSYLKHIEKYGKKNTTIDRIDVNGNYCKENCRWATQKEQANNRRNNHYITYNNETHTLKEWSEILGINYYHLGECIRTGKSFEHVYKKFKNRKDFCNAKKN